MTQPITQGQRLDFLIRCLLNENEEYKNREIPAGQPDKRRLLRSLMNVRPPVPASEEFLKVQDAYLQERLAERGVTEPENLTPVQPGIYLWQGDITTLAADAIVNAVNSRSWAVLFPVTAALTTLFTLTQAYSSVWSVPALWLDRGKKKPQARQKSRKPTICLAAMCCTPWGPSSTEPSQRQTVNCWQAAIALV